MFRSEKRSVSLKNVENIERIFHGFVGRKFSVKPAAALPRIVFSRMRIKVEGGGAKLVTTASPSDTKRRNERFRVGNKRREREREREKKRVRVTGLRFRGKN